MRSLMSLTIIFKMTVTIIVGVYMLLLQNNAVYAQQDYDFQTCPIGESAPVPPLLGGARPASRILRDVDLLSQPVYTQDTQPLRIAVIPQDTWVIVFNIDEESRNWYRILVVCNGFNLSGWIEADAVRISRNRVNDYAAPPGCALPLGTVEGLDTLWQSNVRGRIAIAFDIFRSTSGTRYPDAFFYPTRDGRELRDKERRITTSGAFLLSGSVVNLEVRPGNFIGFSVFGRSSEPLNLFGIIYQVPEGCRFEDR